MTEEVADQLDPEENPNAASNWSPEEPSRVAAMSERQNLASDMLWELEADESNLDYCRANGITFSTLFCLVLLDHELAAHLPDPRLREPSAKLHALLPFDDDERGILATHMKAHEHPEFPEEAELWYEAAAPEDILLLERWRRWLEQVFDDDHIEDSSNGGHALVAAIKAMDAAFGDIV
jgi:hypothetical protein